jgi:hypothetical protein
MSEITIAQRPTGNSNSTERVLPGDLPAAPSQSESKKAADQVRALLGVGDFVPSELVASELKVILKLLAGAFNHFQDFPTKRESLAATCNELITNGIAAGFLEQKHPAFAEFAANQKAVSAKTNNSTDSRNFQVGDPSLWRSSTTANADTRPINPTVELPFDAPNFIKPLLSKLANAFSGPDQNVNIYSLFTRFLDLTKPQQLLALDYLRGKLKTAPADLQAAFADIEAWAKVTATKP